MISSPCLRVPVSPRQGPAVLLRFVNWQILLHGFEVFFVGQEGLKEGFTLNHCVAVRTSTPKEFELKFFLIECDTILGGVGEDEFFFS